MARSPFEIERAREKARERRSRAARYTVPNVAEVARTLNAFERHWNEIAEPYDWNFTSEDLAALIERLTAHEPRLRLAA